MNNLYVYGDSFADSLDMYTRQFQSQTWCTQVGAKLNCNQIKNTGYCGSSIGYALHCFVKDIEADRIQDEDLVIFILSSPDRLEFEYQLDNEQHTAQTYRAYLANPANKIIQSPWLKENLEGLKWYVNNRSLRMAEIHANNAVHMLKSYAEEHPKIKMFVMSIYPNIAKYIKLTSMPSNFFFQQGISLHEISDAEYRGEQVHEMDIRLNHLTIPNLNRLSDLVVQAFTTGKFTQWNAQDFYQRLITAPTSRKDYEQLVEQGLVVYMESYASKWV